MSILSRIRLPGVLAALAIVVAACTGIPHISSPEGTTTTHVQESGVLVYAPRQPIAQKVIFDTPEQSLIHEHDTPLRKFFDSRTHMFGKTGDAPNVDLAKVTILTGIVNRLRNREYISNMVARIVEAHPGALQPSLGPKPKDEKKRLRKTRTKILVDALNAALTEANYPYMREQGIEKLLNEFFVDPPATAQPDNRQRERRKVWELTTRDLDITGDELVCDLKTDLRQSLRDRKFFRDILDDATRDHVGLFARSGSSLSPMQAAQAKLVAFIRKNLGAELEPAAHSDEQSLWKAVVAHLASQKDGAQSLHLQGATPGSELKGPARDTFSRKLRKLLSEQLGKSVPLSTAAEKALQDASIKPYLVPDGGAAASAGSTSPVAKLFRSSLKTDLAFAQAFRNAVTLAKELHEAYGKKKDAVAQLEKAEKDKTETLAAASTRQAHLVKLAQEFRVHVDQLQKTRGSLWEACEELFKNTTKDARLQPQYDTAQIVSGLLETRLKEILDSIDPNGDWAKESQVILGTAPHDASPLLNAWRELQLASDAEKLFAERVSQFRDAAKEVLGEDRAHLAEQHVNKGQLDRLELFAKQARASVAEQDLLIPIEGVAAAVRLQKEKKAAADRWKTLFQERSVALKTACTGDAPADSLVTLMVASLREIAKNPTAAAGIDVPANKARLTTNITKHLFESLQGTKAIADTLPGFVEEVAVLDLKPSHVKRIEVLRDLIARVFKGHTSLIASDEPVLEALLGSPGIAFESQGMRRQAKGAIPAQIRTAARPPAAGAGTTPTAPTAPATGRMVAAITSVLALAKNAVLFGGATPRGDYVAAFKNDLFHAFVDRLDVIKNTEIPVDYDYWWLTFHPKAIPLAGHTIEGQSIIEIGFPERAIRQQQYHRWWQDRQVLATENEVKTRLAGDVLTGFRDVLDRSQLKNRYGDERRAILEAMHELTREGGSYRRLERFFAKRLGTAKETTAGGSNAGSSRQGDQQPEQPEVTSGQLKKLTVAKLLQERIDKSSATIEERQPVLAMLLALRATRAYRDIRNDWYSEFSDESKLLSNKRFREQISTMAADYRVVDSKMGPQVFKPEGRAHSEAGKLVTDAYNVLKLEGEPISALLGRMVARDVRLRRLTAEPKKDASARDVTEQQQKYDALICEYLKGASEQSPAKSDCVVDDSGQLGKVSDALAHVPFDLRHIAFAVKSAVESQSSLPEKIELLMNAYFSGIRRFQHAHHAGNFVVPFVEYEMIKQLGSYLEAKGLTKMSRLRMEMHFANRIAQFRASGVLRELTKNKPGASSIEALIAAYSAMSPAERRQRDNYWFDGISHRDGEELSRYIRKPELWLWEMKLDASRSDLRDIIVNMFRSSYPATPDLSRIQETFLADEEHLVAIIYQMFRDLWNSADDARITGDEEVMRGRIQRHLDAHDYLTEDVRRDLIRLLSKSPSVTEWIEELMRQPRAMDQFRSGLLPHLYRDLWDSLGYLAETLRRPVAYSDLDQTNYESFLHWGQPHVQRGIQIVDMLPASRDDLVGLSISEGGVTARAAAAAEGAAAYDANRIKMANQYISILSESIRKSTRKTQSTRDLADDASNTTGTAQDDSSTNNSFLDDLQELTSKTQSESSSLGGAARGSVYARAKAAMSFAKRSEYLDAAITAAGRGDNFAKWVVRKSDSRGQFATPNGKSAVAAAHNGYPNGGQPFHLLVKVPHEATFSDWTNTNRRYILFNSAYGARARWGMYTEGGWLGAIGKGLLYIIHPPSVDWLEEDDVGTKFPFLFDAKSSTEQLNLMRTENALGARVLLDDSHKIKYSEIRRLIDAEAGFIKTVREAQSGDLSRVIGEIQSESADMLKTTRKHIDESLEQDRKRMSESKPNSGT